MKPGKIDSLEHSFQMIEKGKTSGVADMVCQIALTSSDLKDISQSVASCII